ncbi:uncharacterized protein LOC135825868 [Sycon ciliatum]|uniref:uncharacterized protein LOC135825868 n=1 Tax=Sycon ciliatum TaxID=27933 RepID=UPI0031F64EDA
MCFIALHLLTFLAAVVSATHASNSSQVTWTNCRAPYGKIMMTAFLDNQMYDQARLNCQSLNGDLATVQSTMERECADVALNRVRECNQCNAVGACQCTRLYGSGDCNCGAWVGLTGSNFSNGNFQSWTWFTPPFNATSNILPWRRGNPVQKRDSFRVTYHPPRGGLANHADQARPYLCQRYYPPAPIRLISYGGFYDLRVSAVLHRATYMAHITEYCFTYRPALLTGVTEIELSTMDVCGNMTRVSLSLIDNTLYMISSYLKTVAGLNSSASGWYTFATRPDPPSGVIIYGITDTYVELKTNVTPHGNLPIVGSLYQVGHTLKYSETYNSSLRQSIYVYTNLSSDTSYRVYARIRNKYSWSSSSRPTTIITLPSAPSNLALISTHNEIIVSISDTYKSAIDKYCLILNAGNPQITTTICDDTRNVTFTGATSNAMYTVKAFVVTTDGRNSAASKAFSIHTKLSDADSITTNVSRSDNYSSTFDQVATNRFENNTYTSSEGTSSSRSAVIGTGAGVAGLLVLVTAFILLWKFKIASIAPKPGGEMELRYQCPSGDHPHHTVHITPLSMQANEAYGTGIIAKDDAYDGVDFRGHVMHGDNSGAGGELESGSTAQEHHTYITLQ